MKYVEGIVFLVGDRGVGKTTVLAMLSKQFRNKHSVYANTEIKGTHYFDSKQFGKVKFPKQSVIIMDEAALDFGSREWKTFDKAITRYLKKQRHHRCMLIFASQTYNDTEKTIRDNTTMLYYLKRHGNFTIGKRIVNELVLVPSSNGNQGYMGFDLHFAGLLTPDSRLICYRPLYYKLFDSWSLDEDDMLPDVVSRYIEMP